MTQQENNYLDNNYTAKLGGKNIKIPQRKAKRQKPVLLQYSIKIPCFQKIHELGKENRKYVPKTENKSLIETAFEGSQ